MKPFDPQAVTLTVGGVPVAPDYPPPRALYIAPDGRGCFDFVDDKGTTIARWSTITGAVTTDPLEKPIFHGHRTTPRRAVDLINAVTLENLYLVEASQ